MFKAIKTGCVVAILLGSAISGPAAAAPRKFTIRNANIKASIEHVWFSRVGEESDPWHEVTLDYSIKPGSVSPFTLPDGDLCLFDIKYQFSDGYVQQKTNVNVCRGDTIEAS